MLVGSGLEVMTAEIIVFKCLAVLSLGKLRAAVTTAPCPARLRHGDAIDNAGYRIAVGARLGVLLARAVGREADRVDQRVERHLAVGAQRDGVGRRVDVGGGELGALERVPRLRARTEL